MQFPKTISCPCEINHAELVLIYSYSYPQDKFPYATYACPECEQTIDIIFEEDIVSPREVSNIYLLHIIFQMNEYNRKLEYLEELRAMVLDRIIYNRGEAI